MRFAILLMGVSEHKAKANEIAAARCAVVTVSDSKSADTDISGKLALEIVTKFGHMVAGHQIVRNNRRAIVRAVTDAFKGGADLVVTIGGTGPSKRDVSIEAVRDLIDKELPGFGELFRSMSQKEIGTAAIMSRALLGVTEKGGVVLATPGSTPAVRLALEGILMNELKHLLWELRRYS